MGSAPYAKFGQLLVIFVLCAVMLTSLLAGAVPDGLFGAFLAAIMIAIALVDARRYIIPNEFTLAALALALVRAGVVLSDVEAHPVAGAVLRAAITAAIFWLLSIGYRHFRGREGFGLGDVKLLGVAAAWLDWPAQETPDATSIQARGKSHNGLYFLPMPSALRPGRTYTFPHSCQIFTDTPL